MASFDAKRGSAVAWITMIATSRARDRIRAERACHGGVLELCAHDEAADRPDPAHLAAAHTWMTDVAHGSGVVLRAAADAAS